MSPLIQEIWKIAPNIAIQVYWKRDHNFKWDGDGPDPIEQGLYPHDVTVRVYALQNGCIIQGEDCLGGSYKKLKVMTEADEDIHGYLPQMLEEAFIELGRQIPIKNSLIEEIDKARAFLKAESKRRWEEEQKAKQ